MNPTTTNSPPRAGKWVVSGTVILGAFVSVMDLSIVNVAMPQMLGTFGVTLETVTWVAVSYSIAEVLLVTMAAWFSTLLGRKRFYLLSFALFTGASVLCGLARSFEMMIFARVLQGIGGGGLIPIAQSIMLETFPEEERGMAMALFMMGVVVAPTVGPAVGGWLTDAYGWPWIFYINVPVGILGMLLAGAVLTDPPYVQRKLARIDVVGIVLLAVGLTTLQIFLERGERENWFESNLIVVAAVLALVTLVALVWWELRTEEPIINLRVFKNGPFTAGVGLGFIFGLTLFGSMFLQPLFLQQLRGYPVFDSALILMPRAGVMVFLAPIAGRLYNYVDSRLLIGAGIGLMLVGYYDMAHFNLDVGGPEMLRSLLFSGGGMAFMFSVLTAASMRTMPLPLMMAAASLYTLSRRIGGNIGYAFAAGLITRRSAVHRARLVDHITPYDSGTQQTVYEMTIGLGDRGLPPGVAEETALKLVDLDVTRHAAMLAYNDVFWVMGMLFVFSLPFLLLLGSRRRSADPGGGDAAAKRS